MVKSEREFANFLESQGKTWVSHPKRFYFGGTSYQADFYCPEDDIYYEVKTESIPNESLKKYILFKKYFPHLKLKIVSPNGYPYYSRSSYLFFDAITKKMNLLKSKDILDLTYEDFIHIKDFSVWKPGKEHYNGRKTFPLTYLSMKNVQKIKKKLGIDK